MLKQAVFRLNRVIWNTPLKLSVNEFKQSNGGFTESFEVARRVPQTNTQLFPPGFRWTSPYSSPPCVCENPDRMYFKTRNRALKFAACWEMQDWLECQECIHVGKDLSVLRWFGGYRACNLDKLISAIYVQDSNSTTPASTTVLLVILWSYQSFYASHRIEILLRRSGNLQAPRCSLIDWFDLFKQTLSFFHAAWVNLHAQGETVHTL